MAEIDFKEEDLSTLKEVIETKDSELKEYMVDYVGNKLTPESGKVNVGMIIDVLADEFPEFVLALAEENWVRGYQQALTDVDVGKQVVEDMQKHDHDPSNAANVYAEELQRELSETAIAEVKEEK